MAIDINTLDVGDVLVTGVFVYVKDGVLRLSVDLDSVDDGLVGESGLVPVNVTVEGNVVYDVGDEDDDA